MKLRFGHCLFDQESRQLFCSDKEMHLSPKAFELLKVLIDMRPRAVSKAELHQKIWPTVFVSDDSLAKLVKEIRDAIDDDAREARYLRTVYGFGYAFTDTIETVPPFGRPAHLAKCWLIWEGREVRLAEGENMIGRDPDARVVLDFPRVSRYHARVLLQGADAVLEDFGSKNGTYLRGMRISKAAHLAHGDDIKVGPVVLHFRVMEAQGPTESDVE